MTRVTGPHELKERELIPADRFENSSIQQLHQPAHEDASSKKIDLNNFSNSDDSVV